MKRTPLRRKESLRDSYARKLKENGYRDGHKFVTSRGRQMVMQVRKKPLKKVSRSQREKLKKYFAVRNEFLARPENEFCQICRSLGYPILSRATEVHHYAGRCSRLLTYVPYFIPSCFAHREWPHVEKALARSLGLLCEQGKWNVFPEENADLKSPANSAIS